MDANQESIDETTSQIIPMIAPDIDVILKKGKYGLYLNYNSKNYSLKGLDKKEEDDIPAFDQATDNRMTRKKDFSEFSFT